MWLFIQHVWAFCNLPDYKILPLYLTTRLPGPLYLSWENDHRRRHCHHIQQRLSQNPWQRVSLICPRTSSDDHASSNYGADDHDDHQAATVAAEGTPVETEAGLEFLAWRCHWRTWGCPSPRLEPVLSTRRKLKLQELRLIARSSDVIVHTTCSSVLLPAGLQDIDPAHSWPDSAVDPMKTWLPLYQRSLTGPLYLCWEIKRFYFNHRVAPGHTVKPMTLIFSPLAVWVAPWLQGEMW